MDQYAVLGNPIKHSLSPKIHQHFAQQTGNELQYQALLVPYDGFADFIANLHNKSYQGMNVTVPFKEEAWQLSETHSDRAKLAGAVNTLIRTDTGWRGDNTDGAGLVKDLKNNLQQTLQGKNILILGAGGATRGVIKPLLDEQPKLLHIANRTIEKAENLTRIFTTNGNISHSGLSVPFHKKFDLIINATAASLEGKVPEIPDGLLNNSGCCYDMMYATEPTAFMHWAQSQNAGLISDGLGMLIEQAAESFRLWRGIQPKTTDLLQLFRSKRN